MSDLLEWMWRGAVIAQLFSIWVELCRL